MSEHSEWLRQYVYTCTRSRPVGIVDDKLLTVADYIDQLERERDETLERDIENLMKVLRQVEELREKLRVVADRACEEMKRERDEAQHNTAVAIGQNERLRKIIEDAPHSSNCRAFTPGNLGNCDCWKSEALK